MGYNPQYPDEFDLVNDVYAVFNEHCEMLLSKFPPDKDMLGMMLEAGPLSQENRDQNRDAANLIKFFVFGYHELGNNDQIALKPVLQGLQQAIKDEVGRKTDALKAPLSTTNMMSLLASDPQIMSLLNPVRQIA